MKYDPTKDFITERLRNRATMRRYATPHRSNDSLALLLEEAADVIEMLALNTKKEKDGKDIH